MPGACRSLAGGLSICFVLGAAEARAQTAVPADTTASCFSYRDANPVIERRLRKDHSIVVRPHQRGPEEHCRIEILDHQGGSTLTFIGFGARLIDAAIDLDNDGDLDLLIEVDVGGGNRCCRILHAIALEGTPRELWQMGPNPTSVERSSSGTLLFVVHPFHDLGPSMAESPILERVLRPSKDAIEDVTHQLCDSLLAPSGVPARWSWNTLTPENRRLLLGAPNDTLRGEVGGILASVYTIVLQQVACERIADADALIGSTVPTWLRVRFRDNVWRSVRSAMPSAAARIAHWRAGA
jgi:hypothetical protein